MHLPPQSEPLLGVLSEQNIVDGRLPQLFHGGKRSSPVRMPFKLKFKQHSQRTSCRRHSKLKALQCVIACYCMPVCLLWCTAALLAVGYMPFRTVNDAAILQAASSPAIGDSQDPQTSK